MANLGLSDFDYDLPAELIAQRPLERRDASRLLSLGRETGAVAHLSFGDLPGLMESNDILVVNRSRVIPARLTAIRENGREAEVLLVREEEPGTWTAMVHPGGKLKRGRTLRFGDLASCQVVDVLGGGLRRISFDTDDVDEIMRSFGSTPLPPYIEREPDDRDRSRYQTIFAREGGSVAAPTAGLHFSEEIMKSIAARGIRTAELLLHVGPGTFKPVAQEDISSHTMHSEFFHLEEETADLINEARNTGGRVWAVGTTTARVLETCAGAGVVKSGTGMTDIFIRPPYRFEMVDALITNFHLPRSTLLMLVAAMAGLDRVLAAYAEAVANRYRFFSYGDAMVIH